jgi:hypothetical protein
MLAIAALVLFIIAGALALLLPREYLHVALVVASTAGALLAAESVF